MNKIVLLVIFGVLMGCSSTSHISSDGDAPIAEDAYSKVIEEFTDSTRKYQGFYNTFEAQVTALNTSVQSAQLQRKGAYYQWNAEQAQKERDKVFQDMSSGSVYFISFFTPETDYNDLHKPKTIWKVYLESMGTRYEGKVKKLTDTASDLQTLYPYFSRFSNPYQVTFSVPMSSVEKAESKVVITSSLGNATFTFRPAQ